ncbi:hypothetical protein BH11BAC2_BH11BAC2_11130 [soil metagenome]
MKTIYKLITILMVCSGLQLKAQVPNGDFETLNIDGTLRNWGYIYLFPVSIDSNGNSYADSIVIDNYFYGPSSDAHSGNYALELRNGYDFTAGVPYIGSASVDTDSVFMAWSGFETISTQTQPAGLDFYYKYFPLNNEIATATLQVFDSAFTLIGDLFIPLNATPNGYTYVSSPMNYTSTSPAAYYYLNFNNCSYSSGPAVLGTRLLIDDVQIPINVTSTGIHEQRNDVSVLLFPNPVLNVLIIDYSYTIDEVEIKDLAGKKFTVQKISENKFDCSSLPNGIYIASVKSHNAIINKKFVVSR